MKPNQVVVKVQLPLVGDGLPLVYDETKKHMSFQKIPARVYQRMSGEVKQFFYAEWIKETWEVTSKVAPWQDW